MAAALVSDLRKASCGTLVADKGYDSDPLRSLLVEEDIFPCLRVSRKRVEKRLFHCGHYRKRHHVENFVARLKRHRRVANDMNRESSWPSLQAEGGKVIDKRLPKR
jgi:transposase